MSKGKSGGCGTFIVLIILLVVVVSIIMNFTEKNKSESPRKDHETVMSTISARLAAATPTIAPTPTPTATPRVSASELSKYNTINTGDSSDGVLTLKQRLNALGYYRTTSFTKTYTENTSEVISNFQSLNDLPVTGIADAMTQAVLYSDKAIKTDGGVVGVPATPRPTKTSKPTASPVPENLGLEITGMTVGKNIIGQNEVSINVKNHTKKTVDGFSYIIQCVDLYGVLLSQYDWKIDYSIGFSNDSVNIKSGRTGKSGTATLHGFDRAKQYSVAITKIHFTDGDYVTIPSDKRVWKNYK